MSDDGDIVVIGGGYAGVRVARRLDATARVTLVDRKEVFFHRIASLRAGVRPEWTQTPFIPYDRLLTRGRLVVGKAVRIDTTARQVVLGTGERLPYDAVVIATGADYPEPARFTGSTAEEAVKALLGHQKAVEEAGHVLVVGGGPSGVELAAEIRLLRPEARVTLAHSGDALLHRTGSARAGRRAQHWLEEHDVTVRLNSFMSPGPDFGTYRDQDNRIMTADLSIWATGITPNTLWLRLGGHGGWLTDSGHVKVDHALRVAGESNVFAVGDVTDAAEAKVTVTAFAQADLAARNIRTLLRGGDAHKLRAYRPAHRAPLIIPFGSHDGMTLVPVPGGESAVLGARTSVLAKAKRLMTPYVRKQLGYAGG